MSFFMGEGVRIQFVGGEVGHRIMERVGKLDYKLDLPEQLRHIDRNFHVSQLRKCSVDDSTVVPFDDI